MRRTLLALLLLCACAISAASGQDAPNQVRIVLRDGTALDVTEGDFRTFTIPKGPNAPNGPQPLYVRLTDDILETRNGGRGDVYNQGGIPQPMYAQWVVGRFPRKTIFAPELIGARRSTQMATADDWLLISPHDPKHPARKAALADPAYAPSVFWPMWDGGEGSVWNLVDEKDPLGLKHAPDAAGWARVRDLFEIDEDLIAAEPMAAKMMDLYRWDATCLDPNLPPGQTLEGWLMVGTNLARFGGGPWAPTRGGAAIMHTHYTGGCPVVPDGTGGLKPWYEAETHWWVYAARRWPSEDAKRSFKIAYDMTSKSIAAHHIRSDAQHPLRNAWRNEGNEWSGPHAAPRETWQVHKRGTAGPTPYRAKMWPGKAFAAALACPSNPVFVDSADRCVDYYMGGPGLPPQSGEMRIFGNTLRGMYLAHGYLVLIGDTARASAMRAKAETAIKNAHTLANPSSGAYAVDWLPATNTSGTPFTAQTIGDFEGALTMMVKWTQDQGTNTPEVKAWVIRCCEWALTHTTRRAAGLSTDGLLMREWAYNWKPDPLNWNGKPVAVTYNGGLHTAYFLQLRDHLGPQWKAHFDEMQRYTYRNPGHAIHDCGAIHNGGFNWTSAGKWNKDDCIACWFKKRTP
jgi:hypothetical protein